MEKFLKGGQSDLIKLSEVIATSTPILLGMKGVVRGLIWNGATNGQKLALQNKDGSPIAELTATTGTLSPIVLPFELKFDEIHCDDLDGGILLLYLGSMGVSGPA